MFVVIIKEMDYGGEYFTHKVMGPYESEQGADAVGDLECRRLRKHEKVFDWDVFPLDN